MVIDSSAILALLLNEPEADDIEIAIDEDPVRLMSVASGLEAAVVVEARLGAAGGTGDRERRGVPGPAGDHQQ